MPRSAPHPRRLLAVLATAALAVVLSACSGESDAEDTPDATTTDAAGAAGQPAAGRRRRGHLHARCVGDGPVGDGAPQTTETFLADVPYTDAGTSAGVACDGDHLSLTVDSAGTPVVLTYARR